MLIPSQGEYDRDGDLLVLCGAIGFNHVQRVSSIGIGTDFFLAISRHAVPVEINLAHIFDGPVEFSTFPIRQEFPIRREVNGRRA